MNENVKQLREICENYLMLEITKDEAAVCLDLVETDLADLRAEAARVSARLHRRISVIEDAIRLVLADSETGRGGWGPDVTMAGALLAALNDTPVPSVSPAEYRDDHEKETRG